MTNATPGPARSASSLSTSKLVRGFLLGLLVAALVIRLLISLTRFVDGDEWEHLNAASFVAQGERPYVTFFENHPPLTILLLQPAVRSADDPAVIIRVARIFLYLISLGALAVVALLGRSLAGPIGALLAPLLLLTLEVFFQKSLEARPDGPAMLFLLGALLSFAGAARRGSFARLVVGGACLTLSVLFTPKVIYAAAGAVLGVLIAFPAASRRQRIATGLRALVAMAAGGGLVAGLAVAIMAQQGILKGFVNDCVKVSLTMVIDNPAAFLRSGLTGSLRDNSVVWALGVAGLVQAVLAGRHRRHAIVAICGASFLLGVAGLFHIDAPLRQYYLTFVPQLALFAALALTSLLDWVWAHAGRGITIGLLALVLALSIGPPAGAVWNARKPEILELQLRVLNRVLDVTQPGDRVFDCWTGLYLTRLPAFRYFFLNSDVQRLFAPGELEAQLGPALRDPRVRVVIRDAYFATLPESMQSYALAEFAPLPDANLILVRR
ncbi:MAG: glycosyltransferase family 39 protein [Planctomycetota bacterium]